MTKNLQKEPLSPRVARVAGREGWPQKKGENELVRLEWRQKGSTFPLQPWQLSDGTIRFICLTTALLQPGPPSTVVIDEPELGLHPVAIEALAALLHESADRTQLLVSTQSPGLLDHFEAENVVVVERVDGASVFRRLVNDKPQTAPSKRIESLFQGYVKGRSAFAHGPRIAEKLNLTTVRLRCARFDTWMTKLESLTTVS